MGGTSSTPSDTETDFISPRTSGFCFDIHNLVKIKQIPIWNEYMIIHPAIGKGSFGEVFMAYHINTKLVRSIKKVGFQNTRDQLQEYEILRQLDHPNILKLYEVFLEGPHYSLVTDCYKGGSLLDKINEHGKLTEYLAARYLEQILKAVNYIHNQGFMHCDIKPDNILLDQGHKLVKIVDFGMSRKIGSFECHQKSIGTQEYVAPEILENVILPNSDIWACGVTLINMLTGRTPHRHMLCSGKFQLDVDLGRLLSSEVKDLIFQMVEPDPSQRITASSALHHPWFRSQKMQGGIEMESIKKCLCNIKHYLRYNRLQCLFVSMIANFILDQKLKLEPTVVFLECDTDCDGFISIVELKNVIKRVCPQTYKSQSIDNIFKQIDRNKSNSIDLRQFLACCIDPHVVLQPLLIEQVFLGMDLNQDKKVSIKEFKEYVNLVVPENGIKEQLFRKLDRDGSGQVTLQQFVSALRENLEE